MKVKYIFTYRFERLVEMSAYNVFHKESETTPLAGCAGCTAMESRVSVPLGINSRSMYISGAFSIKLFICLRYSYLPWLNGLHASLPRCICCGETLLAVSLD